MTTYALQDWLDEVVDDDAACGQLVVHYTRPQLGFTVAGMLKRAEQRLPGDVLSAQLERDRLAESLVEVVSAANAEAIDVKALLGSDWDRLVERYTPDLERHRR